MMTCNRAALAAAFVLLVASPGPALAYVGPGLGMGALGVALGILGSIFLGIVAVIWYPVKRLLRALRALRSRGTRWNDTDPLPPE